MTPVEVQAMAHAVVRLVQVGRVKGVVTPQHTITAEEICTRYNAKYETDIRAKEDFWQIVQFIRVDLGLPLGSNGKGYFWCNTSEEWEHCKKTYLRPRVEKQIHAMERPTLYFAVKSQGMLELESALKSEFNAEKIPA